jgi:DNA-binding NarL/FixJ family response regulator
MLSCCQASGNNNLISHDRRIAVLLRQDGWPVGNRQVHRLRRDDRLRAPPIDGMGLLRGVKQADPEVPVIIITAFGSSDAKTESYQLGATAFLEKPVDTEQLIATMERVLAPAPC